jgi:VanZ family protein
MATRSRRLVIVVNLTYAVLLLLIGVSPEHPEVAEDISDHAAHALASAVHAALIFAFLQQSTAAWTASILAATGATLYGGFIEMLQLTHTTRTFETADLAANAIGAWSIALIISLLSHLHTKGRIG